MALVCSIGFVVASALGAGGDESPPRGEAPEPSVRQPLDDPWASPDVAAPRMDERGLIRRPGARGESRLPLAGRTGASGWVRTTLSLAGVVALIVLLAWGYRVGARASARLALARGRGGSALIQVLSRTSLAPRQSVCLIRVGSQLVLVGATPDSLRTLSIINDPDLAARLAGQEAQRRPDSHLADFQRCLETQTRPYEQSAGELIEADERVIDIKERLAHAVRRLRAVAGEG